MPEVPFDPVALLTALEQQRVTYIVVGAFARIVQGAEETTHGVDIVPSPRQENLRRLDSALRELNARTQDGVEPALAGEEPPQAVCGFTTDFGELKVVTQPAGTRGYDDLRRAASREPLGRGLRPSVASVGDLSRMLSALERAEDLPKILALRRLAELETSRGIDL
ncbi:MAG: hypothetical protein ACRDQZ_07880 [Mycobacteriales bacterium]